MTKLLLHTCCGPCLIYPLQQLRLQGFDVEGYFYNPNIHGYNEYLQRRHAVETLSAQSSLIVDIPEYSPFDFFHALGSVTAAPERCLICWRVRLQATANAAQRKGCNVITTTLLVSPYQDNAQLLRIGEKVAADAGITFFYQDFRAGFKQAHQQAKLQGIYCQKYCGCIYSEVERFKKQEKH